MTRLALVALVACGGSGSTEPDARVQTCLPAIACAASGQITGAIAGHSFGAITSAGYSCGSSNPTQEGPGPMLMFGDGTLDAYFGNAPHGATAFYQGQDLGIEWIATDSF